MKKLILHLVALVWAISAFSQSDSSDEKKLTFTAAITYVSNQTYAGRKDSLKLPLLVPSLGLKTKGGFFINAKGYCNLSANSGIDGIGLEPGYEFSGKHWNGSVSLIKNFISDSSNLVIAPIKTSMEFYLQNENKVIDPFVGAEYVFSTEGNDFILYGGLSKNIVLTKTDKEPSVSLDPSFSLTAGSQSFYYSYLKNNANAGMGRHPKKDPVVVTQASKKQSQQFGLLSVSLELPVTVAKGNFEWETTPALESPVNLVNSGAAGTQSSKSYVYVSTELKFSF